MSSQDDEYRLAGVEDPKVVLTTSRDPSSRLKMFTKVRKNIMNKCRICCVLHRWHWHQLYYNIYYNISTWKQLIIRYMPNMWPSGRLISISACTIFIPVIWKMTLNAIPCLYQLLTYFVDLNSVSDSVRRNLFTKNRSV